MYHAHLVFNQIEENYKVLDVGGAAQPFHRADYVIDFLPYEKRYEDNTYFLKNIPQRFSKKTWIEQDLSDATQMFPFSDNEFDFVICSHVLEDLSNPFHVLAEMQRVGKRGYIEVPSKFYEQLNGLEFKKMCGASHHRWVIDVEKDENNKNILAFRFKNHLIHFHKKYQVRKPWFHNIFPYINPNFQVLGLFWEHEINFCEKTEELIMGDMSFFENTVRQAKAVGEILWDLSQPVPIEMNEKDVSVGIQTLRSLDDRVTKRLSLLNFDRSVKHETKKYEENI